VLIVQKICKIFDMFNFDDSFNQALQILLKKKEEIEKSLSMILGKGIVIKRHDESDALAIAICHGLLEGSTPAKKVGTKGSSLKQAFKHLENS
jgi:hypothetical protein